MIVNSCPYCGALPHRCSLIMDLTDKFYVRCDVCKARGPVSSYGPDAERQWDRRANKSGEFNEQFSKEFGERI